MLLAVLMCHNTSQQDRLRLLLLFSSDLFSCHVDCQKQEKRRCSRLFKQWYITAFTAFTHQVSVQSRKHTYPLPQWPCQPVLNNTIHMTQQLWTLSALPDASPCRKAGTTVYNNLPLPAWNLYFHFLLSKLLAVVQNVSSVELQGDCKQIKTEDLPDVRRWI